MPAHTSSMTASDLNELVVLLRGRVAPAEARRIGPHHAAVLHTLRTMQPPEADVHAIYKSLIDDGHEMPLSSLYRALKVLEASGTVHRHWAPHDGRPRSVYGPAATPAAHGTSTAICAHCGAALAAAAHA